VVRHSILVEGCGQQSFSPHDDQKAEKEKTGPETRYKHHSMFPVIHLLQPDPPPHSPFAHELMNVIKLIHKYLLDGRINR
jgi:hypothetical protein